MLSKSGNQNAVGGEQILVLAHSLPLPPTHTHQMFATQLLLSTVSVPKIRLGPWWAKCVRWLVVEHCFSFFDQREIPIVAILVLLRQCQPSIKTVAEGGTRTLKGNLLVSRYHVIGHYYLLFYSAGALH